MSVMTLLLRDSAKRFSKSCDSRHRSAIFALSFILIAGAGKNAGRPPCLGGQTDEKIR